MPPPPKSNSRQRVLAQWRGLDLTPLETARAVRARTAADILPQLMKDLRLDARQGEARSSKSGMNSLIRSSPPTPSPPGCITAPCL